MLTLGQCACPSVPQKYVCLSLCPTKVKEVGKMEKLNILMLVRRFDKIYPKHKVKYEFLEAVEEFANVSYHHEDGDILEILKQQKSRPDFIFHYDITAQNLLSPR